MLVHAEDIIKEVDEAFISKFTHHPEIEHIIGDGFKMLLKEVKHGSGEAGKIPDKHAIGLATL